ncbi:MAG: preprotein translocase subunit YajC [Bacteroidetes bacterium]|nr:MAG: preprotein translocase subunit YajC [Bacteroidota bacterium]
MGPPAGGGQGGGMNTTGLILMLVVFFAFMVWPQMRRNKENKKFRAGIGKGDKVVLVSGIHGKIIEDSETTYTIETENQGRLKIEKSAVSMESTKAVYPKS